MISGLPTSFVQNNKTSRIVRSIIDKIYNRLYNTPIFVSQEEDAMVLKWNVTIPPLSGEKLRRGYVYLPENYHLEPQKRYPVMYMFDGHNVFFDEDATYGKSWGMKAYLDHAPRDLIVVGIECNDEGWRRLNEYSPVDFSYEGIGDIRGEGKVYMDWLTETLKQYIDETYRTLTDREHTAICGSSMGGLMSLYAACYYNDVFQRAACLSPSLWVNPPETLGMLQKGKPAPDTWIYMDYGSEELSNHISSPETLRQAVDILLQKELKLTFRIVPGGTHCEASWEKQIPIFMQCLSL